MTAQSERKVRGCCCGIPIRVGAAILAWLYLLGGIATVYLVVLILNQDNLELKSGVKALVIALGSLGGFLVLTSLLGIIATIGLSLRIARIWSTMLHVWFFLQIALDIAVVALLFTKELDSLVEACASLSPNARPNSPASQSCASARTRLGLYYILTGVVRNGIGYFFVRRASSFSRDCAERAAASLAGPNHQPSVDSFQAAKAV